MKLELNHISPYLPYKLRIMNRGEDKVMNGATGWSNHWIGIITVIRYSKNSYPIFRPLSDITDHHADCWGYSSADKLRQVIKKKDLQYHFFEELFEGHWDVFGLIPEGLAIKK